MARLRIESPVLLYRIRNPGAPYREEIGDWEITEEYDPTGAQDQAIAGVGSYRLVLESNPHDTETARRAYYEGVDLVEQIEKLWLYVAAAPLSGPHLGLELVPVKLRSSWRSNFDDVKVELAPRDGLIIGDVSIRRRFWAFPPDLPLRMLLQVRTAYLAASPEVHALVDLHYEARTANGDYARAVGFARALELLGGMLPGRKNKAKERALPIEVRNCLTKPLDWLFELSNTRFNTRHVVNQRLLLAPMEGSEYVEFEENADLVIRGFVADRFGTPVIVTKSGPPPQLT